MSTKFLAGIFAVTAGLVMNGFSQSCVPGPSGLVDWWPGNGNAVDVIGTNNGVIPDPVDVTFAPGEVGEAFTFSGNSPYHDFDGNEVDFGTGVGNWGTNDFTCEFWIAQPPSATSLYGILEKRPECNANINAWYVRVGPGAGFSTPPGDMTIVINDDNTQNLCVLAAKKPINDGVFHHAAFVRAGRVVSIYIDGALNASVTNGGIANLSNSAMFRAGQSVCVYPSVGDPPDGSVPFIGQLDELSLYNRALSSNEIYSIYQAGSAGKCATPPTFTTQPQSQVAVAHSTVTLTASAIGTGTLYYQWSFNGTNIPGAISTNLTITNLTPTNLGTYAVVVSNYFGTNISSNAVVSMYPYLVNPFTGLDTLWGYTNTLSISVWGSGPFTYQWFDDGVAIDNATNQTLSFDGIQTTNAGLYTVIVSNPFGSVTNPPAQVVVQPSGVALDFSPKVTITGVVGYNYIIQSTTNLSDTNSWVTLTNLTLTQPVQVWVDSNTDVTQPFDPHRFYQVLPGQ